MFTLAILIGLYSYCLFFLGVFGLLYKNIVIAITIFFLFVPIFVYRKKLILINLDRIRVIILKEKILIFLLLLFVLQMCVNIVGALGPELSFDALWYHLTFPKLYLQHNSIFFIPGGLLYYSTMPKLGEVLFVGALSFGNETLVRFTHLTFGLLTCLAIYRFARSQMTQMLSVIAVVVFYSNLVVAWESTTAFIDLIRTFYEFFALWSFVLWWKVGKQRWLFLSALMIGFAISTKLLALGSLLIFNLLLAGKLIQQRKKKRGLFQKIILYNLIAILIPLPWFLFAFIHTGNPVYPFFGSSLHFQAEPFSLVQIPIDIFTLFLFSSDPVSPIYLILMPIIIFIFSKLRIELKILAGYSLLSLFIWYFTPRIGGGRFILPYLPAFSIVCAFTLMYVKDKKEYKFIYHFSLILIITLALISILYRSAASLKYMPVIFGQQTKHEFLSNNLNFAFADFYDTDNYFSKTIKTNDVVLLYGFHNLYYVDFSYIDSSWVKSGDRFNYIAVQKSQIPSRFHNWQLLYKNAKTGVKLYKPPEGQCVETCVY